MIREKFVVAPIDALVRLEKSLLEVQHELSQQRNGEFAQALSDVAVRLEQAAEVLTRVIGLIRPEAAPKRINLTPRELEVLGHLAEGLTNSEIAAKCWVSGNTVKFHVKNIFRKLEVRDRGQVIMIARTMQHTSK